MISRGDLEFCGSRDGTGRIWLIKRVLYLKTSIRHPSSSPLSCFPPSKDLYMIETVVKLNLQTESCFFAWRAPTLLVLDLDYWRMKIPSVTLRTSLRYQNL